MLRIYSFDRSTFHKTAALLLLACIILTLPFSITLNSIIIILMGVNWLIEGNFKQKFNRVKYKVLFYLPVSFYLFHVISYLYSSDHAAAAFDLERKMSFIVFPILIGTLQLSKANLKMLLNCHVVACLIMSLVCFLYNFDLYTNFTNTDISNHGFRDELIRPFDLHHVYMSMYFVLALFVNFAFIVNYLTCNLIAKVCHAVSAVFLVYILSVLSARTPLLALLVTSIIVIFLVIFVNRKYLLGLIATLGVIALILSLYYSPRLNYLYRLSENTAIDYHNIEGYYWSGGLNLKVALWNSALQTIERSNWLIGTGIGDIQNEMQKTFHILGFKFASQYDFNAHNQYLETTIGLGLLGLLLLLLQFWIPLTSSFKTGYYLYGSFIIFFFVCSFTECTLNRQKGIVFFCLFNALFAFQTIENKLPKEIEISGNK